MSSEPTAKTHRKPGARKATPPPRHEIDSTPVFRDGVVLDERKRPIPVKRTKTLGKNPRMDPTRVSGPIRVVLEPMLWLAFISGLVWGLVALDPGLRDPDPDVVIWEHTLPMAILVSALLLISSISALMWLTSSTTATRARTAFSGLGMLASGWLFAKLHPVDTADFLGLSWLSIGIGVLLVTICAVPWPTSSARVARRVSGFSWMVALVLLLCAAVVGLFAWEAARVGLVGVGAGGETGWDYLMPFLVVLALLMAGIRFVLQRPAPRNAT